MQSPGRSSPRAGRWRGAVLHLFDARERPYQVQALGGREEVAHERRRRSISRLLSRWSADRDRRTFEEERDRHLKDLGDALQAAGADAVGPLLILLDC
jgi:hypothetical protein